MTRQPDGTVPVTPTKTSSALIAGVFGKQKKLDLWLEEAGKFFEPQGAGTNAFVTSSTLKGRFGAHAVVLTFQVPCARGSVVHSQAHIAQKLDHASTEAIAGMHRLTLNTILAATK